MLPADLEEEVQLDPGPRTVPPPSVAASFLGGRLNSHKEEIEVMVCIMRLDLSRGIKAVNAEAQNGI